MEVGLGILHIQPDQFWNMSVNELFAALDGWAEANGAERNRPLTRSELNSLMERYPD